MKNTFAKMFTVCALAGVLGAAFIGCGDDGSSSPKGTGLPAEVADMEELETYECSMDDIGEKVYVTELEENYECDGEKWFKSYDQTKPSSTSTKSSSSMRADGSNDDEGSKDKSSSSVIPSFSSSSTGIVAPSTVVKGSVTDSRDGRVYKTVTIGTQTWMAENLNYAYNEPTKTRDSSSFCFLNELDSCAKYGRLYLWSAAMDSSQVFSSDGAGCGDGPMCVTGLKVRGVCPAGWHMPDNDEWHILFGAVGYNNGVGQALRSVNGWNNAYGGDDAYGFSVLPAGYVYRGEGRDKDEQNGDIAIFWTSSEEHYDYGRAVTHIFKGTSLNETEGLSAKSYALSIRCVKDLEFTEELSSSSSVIPSSNPLYVDPSTVVKGVLTDERDGQTYRTVKIGSQEWMAQNLNYTYNESTQTQDSSSFCYNNVADSCSKYGRLYLWSAALDSSQVFSADGAGCGYGIECTLGDAVRGVCPQGWHLPSVEEWNTLFNAVGGGLVAGTSLKAESGWRLYKGVPTGSDAYGFSAIPAGFRSFTTVSEEVGYKALFWTTDQVKARLGYPGDTGQKACLANISYNVESATTYTCDVKKSAYPVRCVKDSN
ncbi:MAG: fibrobacter succinogenes major paralogous domain-containing protein [Fibrobacter sp.]|nr:fibrobacter succinogenes major paralogous domain-containing protein [Fibrobacter sp.]